MILIILCLSLGLILALIWGFRNLEDEGVPEYDFYEYRNTSAAYLQAQQNFEQADSQYIDIAINDLCSTENQVNNELRKVRIGSENEC